MPGRWRPCCPSGCSPWHPCGRKKATPGVSHLLQVRGGREGVCEASEVRVQRPEPSPSIVGRQRMTPKSEKS